MLLNIYFAEQGEHFAEQGEHFAEQGEHFAEQAEEIYSISKWGFWIKEQKKLFCLATRVELEN